MGHVASSVDDEHHLQSTDEAALLTCQLVFVQSVDENALFVHNSPRQLRTDLDFPQCFSVPAHRTALATCKVHAITSRFDPHDCGAALLAGELFLRMTRCATPHIQDEEK